MRQTCRMVRSTQPGTPPMTEAEFQTNVIELAKTLGWLIHHDRGDYRNCIGGDPGFPDLVLAKNGRVLFLELKSEKGYITKPQMRWAVAIDSGVGWDYDAQIAYHLVRPSDMQHIAHLLGPAHG